MNQNYLGIISIASYLTVAFAQGLQLFGKRACSRNIFFSGSLVAIACQGWVLYKLIDTPLGQNLDWLIMLSFTLWLMNIFMAGMSLRVPVANLCVLTYPLAALLLGLALLRPQEVVSKMQSSTLTHVFISLMAMSLLTLACFQAMLLGLQNFLLKHRYASLLQQLAPLQTMESLLFAMIWSAVILLSASLLSGFYYGENLLTPFLLPKTILSILAWVLLSLLIMGRSFFGWRGSTLIRWTLSSTLLAVLSYFGTKALLI